MAKAKTGDTVRVHYTGRLSDGTIFDKTEKDEPLEFTIGAGKVLPKFEQAVTGMETGRKKVVEIPSEDAYGEYDEEEIYEIQLEQLPDDLEPEVGLLLEITMPTGRSAVMTVAGFDDESVILDANHPLAGEDLIFEIRLVDVAESVEE